MAEFTCEMCGETHEKAWSDEDAAAEEATVFGQPHRPDDAIVCDDCYSKVVGWGRSLPLDHPLRLDPRE